MITTVFGPRGAPGRPIVVGPDCDNDEWFGEFWSALGEERRGILDWFTYHTYGLYRFMPDCRDIHRADGGPVGILNKTVLSFWRMNDVLVYVCFLK